MGFLDKVKEQGTALAAKAQEGVNKGQASLNDAQSRKQAEKLLGEYGAWMWAQRAGRDDGRREEELARITAELDAFEAANGALPLPAPPVAAPPAPGMAGATPPPPGGAAAAPPPPGGAATPPPPPGGAATPPPPPGGAATPPPPPGAAATPPPAPAGAVAPPPPPGAVAAAAQDDSTSGSSDTGAF